MKMSANELVVALRKNQPGTFGLGLLPVDMQKISKNLTTEQLVSRFKEQRSYVDDDAISAISDALARVWLPVISEEEIRDTLAGALTVCKSPLCSNSLQKQTVQSLQKPESLSTRHPTSPGGKESQSKTTQKRRLRSSSPKDNEAYQKQHDRSLRTSSACKRNEDVSNVHASSPQDFYRQTAVQALNPVVEMDQLTLEELSFYCSGHQQSPVRKRAPNRFSENGNTSRLNEEPCSLPLPAAGSASSEQHEEVSSVGPGEPPETAASDSSTIDIDEALDNRAHASIDEELQEKDEDSPSLLASPPRRHLCDTAAIYFDTNEAAPQNASEPVLRGTVSPSETRQDVHTRPSPVHLSSYSVGKATTSIVDAQSKSTNTRTYLKPSQQDEPLPMKRPRQRFTALEEEAIVYGVMKYGHGSWKEIHYDGMFNERRTTELSDKYRNLERYNHLPRVVQRVKAKLATGVNPFKELRSIRRQKQQRGSSEEPTKPSSMDSLSSSVANGCLATSSEDAEEASGKLQEANKPSAHPALIGMLVSPDDDDDDGFSSPKEPTSSKEPTRTPGANSSHTAVPTSAKLPSSDAKFLASETDTCGQVPLLLEAKEKQRRVPFTPLETEALVSGYMKYGKGSWARILAEGGFIGRTSIQLSDKFRNLRQYRHLHTVMETVKVKLSRGEDPLWELRKVSSSHWKR